MSEAISFYCQAMKTTRSERYEKALLKLTELLKMSREPLTAAALSKRLRCTRATIYNRLTVLSERGLALKWTETRDGKRGPLSTAVSVS